MAKKTVEQSVDEALTYYNRQPSTALRHPTEVLTSQLLIEAGLRAWYADSYERMHSIYKVLHIEEEVYRITRSSCGRYTLHWESRPDAIVEEWQTGVKAGISYKTIDSATDYRRAYFRTDLQGLFEAFFGSELLRERAAARFEYASNTHRIDYIQTIFLQKGRLPKPWFGSSDGSPEADEADQDEFSKADCFLIQCFETDRHSERQPFFNELPGVVPDRAWSTRYWKPGNKTYNRLTMKRRLLTQPEIAPWIEAMKADALFPTLNYNAGESPLDRAIIWEPAIMRSEIDAETAIREAWYQSSRFADGAAKAAEAASRGDLPGFMAVLENYFPKYLKGCRMYTVCQHTTSCFDHMPLPWEVPAGFARRVSHHPREAAAKAALATAAPSQLVQISA